MTISMRMMLVAAATALLAACGGDSSNDPATSQNDDGTAGGGVYSGVYQDDNGDPRLATVVLDEAIAPLLLIHDEQDYVTPVSGSKSGSAYGFAEAGSCSATDSGLDCTLEGQSLSLQPHKADLPAVDMASLAGEYRLLLDEAPLSLSIDEAGSIQFQLDGCDGEGRLFLLQDDTLVGIDLPSQSCASDALSGVIELHSLAQANDALAVYVPDSAFAGYWLR